MAQRTVVGDAVRAHRTAAGLTQEALAERTGLSVRAIRDLETGRVRDPRPASLALLAAALDIDATQLRQLTAASGADSLDRLPAPPLPSVGLVGREELVAQLAGELSAAPAAVLGIAGLAGVGKTSLAAAVAAQARPAFPDGVVWLRLRGLSRPRSVEDALRALTAALAPDSAASDDLEILIGRWAEVSATHRALLVFDDAADEAQVRPLLPAGSGCAVLVTSRRPLVVVEPSALTVLDLLDPAAGQRLLEAWVGTERIRSEPAAAARVVRFCGGLPLALHVAAAKLAARPHWSVTDLADRLGAESERLNELRAGDLDVRSSLSVGYAALPEDAQAMLRAITCVGVGEVPIWLIEAMTEGTRRATFDTLDGLIRDGLVDALGSTAGGGERIGVHDLVRIMGAELAADPAHSAATTASLAGAVEEIAHLVAGTDEMVRAEWGSPAGPVWADRPRAAGPHDTDVTDDSVGAVGSSPDHDGLLAPASEPDASPDGPLVAGLLADEAAVVATLERGVALLTPERVWPAVVAFAAHQQISCRFSEWISLHLRMLERLGPDADPAVRTPLLTSLASAELARGDMDQAAGTFGQAAAAADQARLPAAQRFAQLGQVVARSYVAHPADDALLATAREIFGQAMACGEDRTIIEAGLTTSRLLGLAGQPQEALTTLERARAAVGHLPDIVGARLNQQSAEQRLNLGTEQSLLEAERELRAAEHVFAERGWSVWSAAALRTLAKVLATTGRPAEALGLLVRCRDQFAKVGDRRWVAYVQMSMAGVQLDLGEVAAARVAAAEARAGLENVADARGLDMVAALEADPRFAGPGAAHAAGQPAAG